MGLRRAGEGREEDAHFRLRRYERNYEGLVAALADPDPDVRRWAARDLASFPEAAAELVRRLAQEPEFDVREAIATSLEVIGGPTAVEGLTELLRSEDAALRNTAIEILQHFPTDVAAYVERLLADPDSDLRIFAVNIMEALPNPRTEEWLGEILRSDPHVNVVAAALNLLSEVGSERVLHSVHEAGRRFPAEPFIQFACQMVEKRIRSL
jgi:HEAT repeat protein